jgi:hypothetical protein
MRLLLQGVLLWLAGVVGSGGGRLDEARIQITVSGDTAWVIAWYRFSGTSDSIHLAGTRPAGQTLVFQGVDGAIDFRLDTLSARFQLVSHQADSAPALDVRYHVVGNLTHIPLFVPQAPVVPGRRDVLIRVSGDARPAPRGASQFRPEPGDGWLARLDRVPGIVALAPPR